eukprot:scaffold1800_cov237-Pinguiococcus_pyrenoidosus.AAC.12
MRCTSPSFGGSRKPKTTVCAPSEGACLCVRVCLMRSQGLYREEAAVPAKESSCRCKLEEWQKETLLLLRGKLESAQGEAVKHLESKLLKETNSAIAQLEAHAEKERAELATGCDAKLQTEQERANEDVKKAQEEEASSRSAYLKAVERQTAAEAEAAKAGTELHELRRKTEEALRRMASCTVAFHHVGSWGWSLTAPASPRPPSHRQTRALEEEATGIKGKLQRQVREIEQADVERAAAQYAEVSALKEKIRSKQLALKNAEDMAASKARERYLGDTRHAVRQGGEAQSMAELQEVQKRVNEVVRAKQGIIADLQKQAQKQREATRDQKFLVDQIREKQYG